MRGSSLIRCAATVGLWCLAAVPATAQMPAPRELVQQCSATRRHVGGERLKRFCAARTYALPATGEVWVHAARAGAVDVRGWDRDDLQMVAIIAAEASTEVQAEATAAGVRVMTDGGLVRVEGPARDGRTWWSVDFHIRAPRTSALDLVGGYGGVRVSDIAGRVRVRMRGGDVVLEHVAGDVEAQTTMGEIDVRLAGGRWEGAGLALKTASGAITIHLPHDYSALLDVRTIDGALATEVPFTVQGGFGRAVRARLGAGGPPLRLKTTSGSIRLVPTEPGGAVGRSTESTGG